MSGGLGLGGCAEYVGQQPLNGNACCVSNGLGMIPRDSLPLANRLRRHPADPADLCGATQFFDSYRVHARHGKPRLLMVSSCAYVEMCKPLLQNYSHED